MILPRLTDWFYRAHGDNIRVFLFRLGEALFLDAEIPLTMADLALIQGNIITLNSSQPRAQAIAIQKGRIVKVGSNEEVNRLVNRDTMVVDLKGKTVVPGFIDTHIHVADLGRTLQWVQLNQVDSIKTLQVLVKAKVDRTSKGRWILGSGWNQENFVEKRSPTREDLDAVAPGNPVILYHQLGRRSVTNTRALELAGITKTTAAPIDGIIEKTPGRDEPTGILIGSATDLVWNVVPQPTEDETLEVAREACRKIVEAGITSIHWIALSATELMAAKRLLQSGDVPLRIFLIITDEIFENLPAQSDQSEPKIGGVLVFSDGYLASQTAALNTPYNDDPSNRGQVLYSQEELDNLTAKIHRAKMQVIIHAMGDKAVDAALRALQTLPKAESEFRYRIEQAALLNRQLLSHLRKLKPVVSVQPKVVESEFNVWSAIDHLGEKRARMLFPVKTLMKKGVHVVGGSDSPMEPLNPMVGIHSVVTRKSFPMERLTVEEALRMYTIDAAFATVEEKEKGSIEEGKLADLVILSGDPATAPKDKIAEIAVEMTIMGGKVVYQKLPASAIRDLNSPISSKKVSS